MADFQQEVFSSSCTLAKYRALLTEKCMLKHKFLYKVSLRAHNIEFNQNPSRSIRKIWMTDGLKRNFLESYEHEC
jgi:hypothetical protein